MGASEEGREAARTILGHDAEDPDLFAAALTHGSHDSTRRGAASYERLEFLGDRVLGLVVADWLYEEFPKEAEGNMSRRYNALVARETCAEVGRMLGVPDHVRLGRQAREDRAQDSDNVVGDVVEALLGALYRDAGLAACRDFVREHWKDWLSGQTKAPHHPKSALQERCAAKGLGTPAYELTDRRGPGHAPRFTVRVSIRDGRHADGEGTSKQEAETAAAKTLLEQL